MVQKTPRNAHATVKKVVTPSDLPMARAAQKITVGFSCWNCKGHCEMDLAEIQKDRLEIKYEPVIPNPRTPRKYFIKCESCQRFNSVTM